MRKLTSKQSQFIQEYIERGNATEAANRVYKPAKRATARAIGSENLTKPNIQRTISESLTANGLDADLVVKSLVEDIKDKPQDRVSELLLAFKLLGLTDRARQEQNANNKLPIPIMFGNCPEDQEKIQRVLRMLQDLEGEDYVRNMRKHLVRPEYS